MVSTLSYTGTLQITSCWCGIQLAIPVDLYRAAQSSDKSIYCPLGHTFVYGENKADRLEKQLASTKQRLEWAETRERRAVDNYRAAERSVTAYKGHLTRARNKIAQGNCPVPDCGQHFSNVREHMKHKHPDWHMTDPVTGEKAVL